MGRLANQVTSVMAELEGFTSKEIIALSFDVSAELVIQTPKDTSWASNNWVPQMGSPYRETVGAPTNPSAGVSTRGSALSSIASSYNFKKGSIFVSNNVPYINRLNEGYSDQAPAGFVQLAVLRSVDKARTFRLV
ncbi:MAG: hypothetical protein OEY89_15155 [Gammaproteobacteria bacterium]|nr:hypothetical protein [Gammaproteobacteria bacterium]